METSKITLIVEDCKFQVDKKKLIEKSRYFNSLFSHNFSDSKDDEQTVHYNFDPIIIQDFCDWVEEDPPQNHQVKISLQKYLTDSYEYLKQFVELSIIYTVDELSFELSDIIIQHWLKPSLLLDLWRMAKEFSLTTLADVIFAAILEKFDEIPTSDILNLPLENFLQLTANFNVHCDDSYLLSMVGHKMRSVTENQEAREKLGRLTQYLRNPGRSPKTMHCFYIETSKIPNVQDFNTKSVFAFRKDQPREFKLIVQLWRFNDHGRDLTGVAVVGRGFSIYRIGGEIKLGSGEFNMNIWRYCLISKKWYYQARLRKARRHMIAALIDNKLILIGGVSRYRLKINSVEVLDLETNNWTSAPYMPECFTDTPPFCVVKGIIIICVSDLYMFNGNTNCWLPVQHDITPIELVNVKCLVCRRNTLFIGKEGGEFNDYEIVWNYAQDDDLQSVYVLRKSFGDGPFRSSCEKINIDSRENISGLTYQDGELIIEHGNFKPNVDETCPISDNECMHTTESNVVLYTHKFNFPATCQPISCFSLHDPTHLYTKMVE